MLGLLAWRRVLRGLPSSAGLLSLGRLGIRNHLSSTGVPDLAPPSTDKRTIQAGRPGLPSSYGIKPISEGRVLPWADVAAKLAASRNYWIATASPEGVPHVAPVWGVWYQGALYFGTDPTSRKAKNIAASHSIVAHLESGDDVVIVEGVAERLPEASIGRELDEAYFRKYGYRLKGNATYRVEPRQAFAWSEADFPESATRWRFQDQGDPADA